MGGVSALPKRLQRRGRKERGGSQREEITSILSLRCSAPFAPSALKSPSPLRPSGCPNYGNESVHAMCTIFLKLVVRPGVSACEATCSRMHGLTPDCGLRHRL